MTATAKTKAAAATRETAEAAVERIVAGALRSFDPPAAITEAARDRTLSLAARRALRAIDSDGLRIAALLVARLRFERLLRGSPEAEAWFERDTESFARSFRRYHAEVAPTAYFPQGEAQLFDAWRAREGDAERERLSP